MRSSSHPRDKARAKTIERQTISVGYCLAMILTALWSDTNAAVVHAADIAVLSHSALAAIVPDLAENFRRETGHSVKPVFAGVGILQKRVESGESTDTAIEQMAGQGFVVREPRTVIARVGVGLGVREGATKPDISNTAALKQTLLSAKSVTYSDPARGGVAAIHFARVIERLGISPALKEKTVLGAANVCERVAKGEVELCVTQIAEILPVRGVALVGPLPRELQNVTTLVGAISSRSSAGEAAREFLNFLVRPSFRAKFAEGGLDFSQD